MLLWLLQQEPYSIMLLSAIAAMLTAFATILHAWAETRVGDELKKKVSDLETRVRLLESHNR